MKGPKVYYLITSLSVEESTALKSRLQDGKKAKLLMEILALILSSNDATEFSARKSELTSTTQQYFAQYCNKLFNITLKVLKEYETDASNEKQILDNLFSLSILMDKKLYALMESLIERTFELINKNERYEFYPILAYYELQYKIKDLASDIYGGDHRAKQEKMKEVFQFYSAYHLLSYEELKQSNLFFTKELSETNIHDLKKSLEFVKKAKHVGQSVIKQYSNLSRLNHYTNVLYHLNDKHYKLALKEYLYLVDNYQPNITEREVVLENYWIGLNNCINLMVRNKDYQAFTRVKNYTINCIETYSKHMDINAYYYHTFRSYTCLLQVKNEFGNVTNGRDIVNKIIQLCSSDHSFHFNRLIPSAYVKIINFYFIDEDYNTALEWNNKAYEHINQKRNNEFYNYLKLMEILIHIELKNLDLVKNLFRSYRRKRSTDYKNEVIEREIDLVLKSIINQTSNSAILDKAIKNMENIPESRDYHRNINVLAWLNAKKEDQSLSEVLAKIHKSY